MNRSFYSLTKYELLTWFLGIFFVLNGLKPWIDIFVGVSNQVVTGVQLILCLSVIQILTLKNRKLSLIMFVFLGFVFVRFLSEILIMTFESEGIPSFLAASFSALRFYMFALLLLVLGSFKSDAKVVVIKKIFIAYFILTLVYSIMQHPSLFNFSSLHTAGGNIVSGNGIGIQRMNGGIGGTVISYSNFLLSVSWVLFYCKSDNAFKQNCLFVCLGISVLLCFSRSLFLCLLVMFLVDLIMKKRFKSMVLITGLVAYFVSRYLVQILDSYTLMVGGSDISRRSGWVSMFSDSSSLEVFLGSRVGGNTGLITGGLAKLSGDGFILGTINDFGIFGAVFFVSLFVYSVFKLPNIRPSVGVSICLTFFIMLFVNSGFEKLTVMLSYFVALVVISYSPSSALGNARKVTPS